MDRALIPFLAPQKMPWPSKEAAEAEAIRAGVGTIEAFNRLAAAMAGVALPGNDNATVCVRK